MGEAGCLKDGHFQNLEYHGELIHTMPWRTFAWDYTDCMSVLYSHAQSSDSATAAGHVVPAAFPDKAGKAQHTHITHLGATTAAIKTPVVTGTIPTTDTATTNAGLNLQFDNDTAGDLGFEMNFGHPNGTCHKGYIVGKHSGYIDATLFCTEWTTYDGVFIGFRKGEPPQVGHAPIVAAGVGDPVYTDFASFGIQECDKVQFASDLNGGGTGIYTDSTMAPVNSQNIRFRVTLNTDGTVNYGIAINGVAGEGALAAPTAVPATFTFDQGDIVIPYMVVHGFNHDDTPILLKHLEIVKGPKDRVLA